ncbi:MAG: hypothetical protein QOE66_531 [Chloroflexota bacterium]|jgi:hypothetical protein|nr:hypothetical protein [Chloroflexota bacterium]
MATAVETPNTTPSGSPLHDMEDIPDELDELIRETVEGRTLTGPATISDQRQR